jgi:hypothetical protein
MAQERYRLPFTIEEVYQGLARVGGLLSLTPEGILLEFEIKDSILGGVFRSKPRSILLPFHEIISTEVKSSLFRTVFLISVERLALLADLPKSERGEARLSIRRSDREIARQVEARIRFLISEMRLDPEERSGLLDP